MKKVLIIAYAFPPYHAIGSQRPFGLAKYFPQYGWKPIVLTVDCPGATPQGIKVIKVKHINVFSSIKSKLDSCIGKLYEAHTDAAAMVTSNGQQAENKIYRFIREAIFFPDPARRGWYKTALKSAFDYLEKEKVDVIISTSSPETAHLIAKKIKQKYRIPWIADLRDLWTQNHFYNKFDLIKYVERRLELKTLSDADALVTVTPRFVDNLKIIHKNKNILCITNGYDADDFSEMPVELTDKFTITHTGGLYQGKRSPLLLFEVVSQLLNENRLNKNIIEISFYGRAGEWLAEMTRKHNLQNIVNYYGLLSREEALKKQKESHILLLLLDINNKEANVYPAKIFEYFGAKRPIIAIGGQGGIVKELLNKSGTGKFADNPDILKRILLEYYHEFIQFGKVKCVNGNIENYSYASIAKKYSDLLNGIVI